MNQSGNRCALAPNNKPAGILRRLGLLMAMAGMALVVSAQSAAAQATYEYVGNPFTLFSCGPNSSNTATLLCSNPGPNATTSYTATDHVEATLVLDNPLPASMAYQDVRTFAGFSLTMNDGQHTVTNLDALGMFAEVSTDANGDILQWRLVLNTGGTANGGITTINYPASVSDSGTLACCDPTVPGDLARNSGIAGVWSSGTPTPEDAVSSLIIVVADPLLGLTDRQVNSLTAKLNKALAFLEADSNAKAAKQLNAFIKEVQTAVNTRKMSPTAGTTLVNAANAILALL